MTLISGWKKAWKFWSVQLSAIGMGVLAFSDVILQVWGSLPPSLSMHMPHPKTTAIVLFGLGMIARIIQQGATDEQKDKD